MIAPCKDCVERHVGCHASCPRYAEFKAGCNARRQERAAYYPIKDYTVDSIVKTKKAAHRRRRK